MFVAPFQQPFAKPFNPGAGVLPNLVYDIFTDTDGTNLSSHTIAPTNTISASWTVNAGTWDINGNRARITATADANATINAGKSNATITGIVNVNNTSSPRVRGLTVWSAYFVGVVYNSNIFVIQNAARTNLASISFTCTYGVDYTIQVVCSGTTITATVNGANQISYTGATATNLFGLAGRTIGDKFDNFTLQ
jgi:hypothetical protein